MASGTDGRAVFGSSVERVRTGDAQVNVSTLFGSVEVVVPDGLQVDTSGLVVFGSVDCDEACEVTSDEVVTVRSVGGFGSVEIVTESEYDSRNR